MLHSFKLKLVAYFVFLSLVPMGAAFWGFTSVAGTSSTRQVDARLQAGLRTALAAYQERLAAAAGTAEAVARTRGVQIALARRDRRALESLLADRRDVAVTAPGGFEVGSLPRQAVRQSVDVVTARGQIGTVVASVGLGPALVAALRSGAGLGAADSLALLSGDRIVASSPSVRGVLDATPGRTETVPVGGTRYRVLVAPGLAGALSSRLAVLSPQSRIDAAAATTRNRLLLGLLGALALVSVVAYLEGRSIVRTLRALAHAARGIARGRFSERVPVRGRDEFATLGTAFNEMAEQLERRLVELQAERTRVGQQIARFGEALSATHDVGQLLRLVVETAVEATGASGARLRAKEGTVVTRGAPDGAGERLELDLAAGGESLGSLELVGETFGAVQRTTAETLASQAAIALDNARLHRLVERQARVDGLTGLANRRRCEEALHTEIARAERHGTPLSLVLADLDDFKTVNDVHGHAVGDQTLRAFASIVRDTVRESDVAGRWGGEEFLILLPDTDAQGAARLADRLRVALAATKIRAEGGTVNVTASFGVAGHRRDADWETLFAAADRALYRAKREGKDRVEVECLIRLY